MPAGPLGSWSRALRRPKCQGAMRRRKTEVFESRDRQKMANTTWLWVKTFEKVGFSGLIIVFSDLILTKQPADSWDEHISLLLSSSVSGRF